MEQTSPKKALDAANYLLGSVSFQTQNPEVLLEQLTTLFLGKPYGLIQRMLHPETGVLRDPQLRFNPIGVCADWLEFRMPKQVPEHRPFKSLPMPKPDPEEAKRRMAIAAQIKAATKRRARAPAWDGGQTLKPSEIEEIERYIADPDTP